MDTGLVDTDTESEGKHSEETDTEVASNGGSDAKTKGQEQWDQPTTHHKQSPQEDECQKTRQGTPNQKEQEYQQVDEVICKKPRTRVRCRQGDKDSQDIKTEVNLALLR